jgi:hypothetical protein
VAPTEKQIVERLDKLERALQDLDRRVEAIAKEVGMAPKRTPKQGPSVYEDRFKD